MLAHHLRVVITHTIHGLLQFPLEQRVHVSEARARLPEAVGSAARHSASPNVLHLHPGLLGYLLLVTARILPEHSRDGDLGLDGGGGGGGATREGDLDAETSLARPAAQFSR